MKKIIFFFLLFSTVQIAVGQNLGIFDEVITKDSQRIAGDWISGVVGDSSTIAAGGASKLVNAPGVVDYVTKVFAASGGGDGNGIYGGSGNLASGVNYDINGTSQQFQITVTDSTGGNNVYSTHRFNADGTSNYTHFNSNTSTSGTLEFYGLSNNVNTRLKSTSALGGTGYVNAKSSDASISIGSSKGGFENGYIEINGTDIALKSGNPTFGAGSFMRYMDDLSGGTIDDRRIPDIGYVNQLISDSLPSPVNIGNTNLTISGSDERILELGLGSFHINDGSINIPTDGMFNVTSTAISLKSPNRSNIISVGDGSMSIGGMPLDYQADYSGSYTSRSLVDKEYVDNNSGLQTIGKVGQTVTLSDGGGSFTDDVDDADASPSNELQTIDVSQLVGTDLQLSLLNDGEATKVIDLSPLQDGTGTDDQTAVEVPNTPAGNIAATNVQAAINELDSEKLSVEVDGSTTNELNTSVTMAAGSLSVTDAGGAKSVSLISTDGGNTISAGSDGKLYSPAGSGESTTVSDTDDIDMTLTGSDITATVKIDVAGDNIITKSVAGLKATEVDGDVTNELQTFDVSQLTGTNLELSLSNDGEATKVIDLSSLQDGTGTDDQTAAEVSNTPAGNIAATNVQAAINELDTEKLSVEVDGSVTNEIQTIDVSQLIGTDLQLSLLNDSEATKVIDLSSLVDDADANPTNELQTVANTSDATTHTVTLSNSGGSLQLAEGANITLSTTGTGTDGVVTIAASGGSGTTNSSVTVTGDNEKTITIEDSEAATVTTTFNDLGTIASPSTRYISETAYSVIDTFDSGTLIGVNQDFAISPHFIADNNTGKIYNVFRVSSTHLQTNNMMLVIRISIDGGDTWTGVDSTGTHTIITSPYGGNYPDCTGGAVTPTGRLVLFTREFTGGGAYVKSDALYSDDDGATFTLGGEIPGAPIGYMFDSQFVLGESRELIFGQRVISTNRYIRYFQSFDNGVTWTLRSTALDNSDTGDNFGEVVTRDLGGGTFVSIVRLSALNAAGLNQPFMITSHDYGRTWAGQDETLSFGDVDAGNHQSGFLGLEGATVTLGGVTANESCLAWFEVVEKNSKRYFIVHYYVRYLSGVGKDSWRMTVFDADKWLALGQAAIDTTIFKEVFVGDIGGFNAPDGNGNFLLNRGGDKGIATINDNFGTGSGGPSNIVSFRLPDNLIDSLIDEYELPFHLRDKISAEQSATFTASLFKTTPVDCSGGAITVNPIANPSNGDWFAITDVTESAATNNITIDFVTATQNLFGTSQNHVISTDGGFVRFTWMEENSTWFKSN